MPACCPPFDKPVVILPHYGEFGFFIFRHLRLIHEIQAPRKIVCCKRGQELYFPSVSEFFYDWKNPLTDYERRGWHDWDNEDKQKLVALCDEKYSDHEIVDLTKYDGTIPQSIPEIKPNKIRNLKSDIVIGARMRNRNRGKNWGHWSELGKMLTLYGLSYSVLGREDSSFSIEGAKHYSWEYPDEDSEVELIQSSKLFVGNNTGTAHLAALLQKPMIVIKHPKMGDDPFTRMMKDTNSQKVIKFDEPWPELWHDPSFLYKAIVNHDSINRHEDQDS